MYAAAGDQWTAEALLAAADRLTRLSRLPVHAGDSLLDGAEAVLDLEAGTIWYNQDIEPELAVYFQVHEYAHYWLHGEHCTCRSADIDSGASDEELPLGIQWVEGYSPQERREREANVFAREFLLPVDKLRQSYLNEGLSATAIATQVGVSEALVFHQLTHALLIVDTDENETKGDKLNLDLDQQKAARVSHGPFLLEAGPGTGKTRSLVERVLFLLERQVEPDSILILTFSNRAAEEVRVRVAQANPDAAPRIWIGTFHAFGLELLRKFGAQLGLPARLSVLDPVDAVFILERQLPALPLVYYQNLYAPTTYLGSILEAISRAKDEMVDYTEYAHWANQMYEQAQASEQIEAAEKAQEVAQVYAFYQQYLEREQLLDFGDLIFRSVILLRTHEDIKQQIRQTYPYILVDEYQDVNRASGLLLREIAGDGKGLWVVGDARQSIYRFRGATPLNMNLFPQDFPGAEIRSLKRNYRSQPVIVNLVATLASRIQATQHSPFVPWGAERPDSGGKVLMEIAENREAEGLGIAREIKRQQAAGVAYRDQAVLCRAHSQLASIATNLEQAGIPILSLGNLFERDEVRDLLALLSLVSQGDGRDLIRVARFTEYQIPLEDVLTLLTLARQRGVSFPEALGLAREAAGISSQGQQGFRLLEQQLSNLYLRNNAWSLLVYYLFEYSNYLRLCLNDRSVTGQQKRLAIFQFLQLAYRQRGMETNNQDQKLAFLNYVRRLEIYRADKQLRQISAGEARIDAVRLLTVHAAKGLEFKTVYLPFLGQGYFPAKKQGQPCPPPVGMIAGGKDWHTEEEECLFFVAISRARDMLCLSRARHYGRTSNPSNLLTLITDRLPHPPGGPITWPKEQVVLDTSGELEPVSIAALFKVETLERYLRCPRQYFYEFILDLKGEAEDTAYALFHRCVYAVLGWVREELAKDQVDEAAALAQLAAVWKEQGPLNHPYETIYRRQAEEMVIRAINHLNRPRGHILRPEWEIQLTHGRVRFKPDYLELSDQSSQASVLIQRLRAGRPTESELDKDIYALYQQAAEQAYPQAERTIQIVYLSTHTVQPVSLSSKTINTRLGHYDKAIAGIRRKDFPAQPAERQQCPQCPYYFICPAAEATKRAD